MTDIQDWHLIEIDQKQPFDVEFWAEAWAYDFLISNSLWFLDENDSESFVYDLALVMFNRKIRDSQRDPFEDGGFAVWDKETSQMIDIGVTHDLIFAADPSNINRCDKEFVVDQFYLSEAGELCAVKPNPCADDIYYIPSRFRPVHTREELERLKKEAVL